MNADYFREERTRTTVRHVVEMPVQWVDMQKLLRIVITDMGYPTPNEAEPSDDAIWYEIESEGYIAICYELTTGISGGPSDVKAIR